MLCPVMIIDFSLNGVHSKSNSLLIFKKEYFANIFYHARLLIYYEAVIENFHWNLCHDHLPMEPMYLSASMLKMKAKA